MKSDPHVAQVPQPAPPRCGFCGTEIERGRKYCSRTCSNRHNAKQKAERAARQL